MKFLEYNGEKLPLKIGFYALKHFQAETKKNILELQEDLSMADLETLFYHSYVNGCLACKAQGWTVKYKREDAETMMDDIFLEFAEMVPALVDDFLVKKKLKPAQSSKKITKKVKTNSAD